MNSMTRTTYHKSWRADLFPMLPEDELRKLGEHIRQNRLSSRSPCTPKKTTAREATWSEALLNRLGGARAKNRMAEHFRRPTADNRNPHIRMPRYQRRFPENRRSLRGFGLRRRWPKSWL